MNFVRPVMSLTKSINLLGKSYNLTSRATFKSDLKIKWVHPGIASCISTEKSGDLDDMPSVCSTEIQQDFKHCKELEDASDTVKRLFSLEFGPRRKATQIYIRNMGDKVRRHPLDTMSVEAKIGRWTGCIRSFQERMEKFPRDSKLKVVLKELIDKRKKLLKRLRIMDYKRFEWVINNLNLVYKPQPLDPTIITRKASMVKLTDKYCKDLKTDKLNKYKLQLEAEQPIFLQEKIDSLEFIHKEQTECGVDVTVTQEEIDNVKKQLQELLAKREQTKPEVKE